MTRAWRCFDVTVRPLLLQDSLNEALRGELSRLQQHAATHGVTGGGQAGSGGAGAHMAEMPGMQLVWHGEALHAPFPDAFVVPSAFHLLTAASTKRSMSPPLPVALGVASSMKLT